MLPGSLVDRGTCLKWRVSVVKSTVASCISNRQGILSVSETLEQGYQNSFVHEYISKSQKLRGHIRAIRLMTEICSEMQSLKPHHGMVSCNHKIFVDKWYHILRRKICFLILQFCEKNLAQYCYLFKYRYIDLETSVMRLIFNFLLIITRMAIVQRIIIRGVIAQRKKGHPHPL